MRIMEIVFVVVSLTVLIFCTYAITHAINRVADSLEAISSDFNELLANIEMKESE